MGKIRPSPPYTVGGQAEIQPPSPHIPGAQPLAPIAKKKRPKRYCPAAKAPNPSPRVLRRPRPEASASLGSRTQGGSDPNSSARVNSFLQELNMSSGSGGPSEFIEPLIGEEPHGVLVYEKGTTTLGFICNEKWIMVAVDHPFKSPDAFPENVRKINPHLLVAFSGGSEVSRLHLTQTLVENDSMTASELKDSLSGHFSSYPDSINTGKSLGILIAGWDRKVSLPILYKIDGNGDVLSRQVEATGSSKSGARVLVLKRLDYAWRFKEAIEMAIHALSLAVYIAPTCDEYLTVFSISRKGIEIEETNLDIAELQKTHFASKGCTWLDRNTRSYCDGLIPL